MFSDIKDKVRTRFQEISSEKRIPLFQVNVDREKIWELYLNGFEDAVERQSHNCNCCKSFLRQWSGIVALVDNKMQTMWDISDVEELYQPSITAIRDYIRSLPIAGVFLNDFGNLGTDKNYDLKTETTWQHFYITLSAEHIYRGGSTIDTVLGDIRTTKEVFKRSLTELTVDACETVLDLISQNSLYRGKEFEGTIRSFLEFKKEYQTISEELKDNFCWTTITSSASNVVAKIRNSAIGTLLIALSEGEDLDRAVSAFERVVAPTNYKRPAAIITQKMIEEAQTKINELGFTESLERRYATIEDINIADILFIDKSSEISGSLQELIGKEITVNPKTFSKVDEIGIEDFINNVVPTSKSIKVLLENSHLNNMVSLVTGAKEEAPTMFKWPNPFSWSYTGGITDSIKERVKAAGGNVDGEIRVSLSWSNYDDLDLHVVEPNNNRIWFSSKMSRTSGRLDVDMNAGDGTTRTPVENITWNEISQMLDGTYRVIVNQFQKRENIDNDFTVQIECRGEVYDFAFKNPRNNSEDVLIATFNYSKKDGITKMSGEASSSVVNKEKWNLKTNQFHKVTNLMLSPNYWNSTTGNKHYLFMLENCISDENPRPFFNEFLKEELLKEKRVFEVLGSKLKVEGVPSTLKNQMSGVGFSETQKSHIIVQVDGSFKRNLKVVF
jgi:hypothetical protein